MLEVICPSCDGTGEEWFELGAVDAVGPYVQEKTYECSDCDGAGEIHLDDSSVFQDVISKISIHITEMRDTLDYAAETRTTDHYLAQVNKLRKIAREVDDSASSLAKYV